MESIELADSMLVHFDVHHLGTLATLGKASAIKNPRTPKSSRRMASNGLDIQSFDYIDDVTKLYQSNQVAPPDSVHHRAYNTIANRTISLKTAIPFQIVDIGKLGFNSVGPDLYEFNTNHLKVTLAQKNNLLKLRNNKVFKMKDKPIATFDCSESGGTIEILKKEIGLIQNANSKSNHTLQADGPIVQFKINTADGSMETLISYSITYGVYVNEHPPTNVLSRVANYLTPLVEPFPIPATQHQMVDPTVPVNAEIFYDSMSRAADDLPVPEAFELPELETDLLRFQTKTVDWMLKKECCSYDPVSSRCYSDVIISQELLEDLQPILASGSNGNDTIDREVSKVLDHLCFGWQRVKFKGQVFWFNRYIGNLIDSMAIYRFIINYHDDKQSPKVLPAKGLLAEEMGLGKTVEVTALALLNPRPIEQIDEIVKIQLTAFGDSKPIIQAKTTLIIAPDSILKQWVEEILRLAPSLAVTIYKGVNKYPTMKNNARLIADYLRMFDIVFTTYSTISKELDYALYSSRNNNTRAANRKRKYTEFAEADEEQQEPEPEPEPEQEQEQDTHDTEQEIEKEPETQEAQDEPQDTPSPTTHRQNYDPNAIMKDFRSLFQLTMSNKKPKVANTKTNESQEFTDYEKALQDEIELALQHNEIPDIYHAVGYESPLMLLQFWRVVLDEVQMVSSQVSRPFQSSSLIPRYHAWAVSGTPIKKNLGDLHSILEFLRFKPFNGKISKNCWEILTNINVNTNTDFIKLWKIIGLRHTKAMVHDDIKLPLQNRVLMTIPFNLVEQENYNQVLELCLSSIYLDVNGAPILDTWEPTPTIISYMKTWLVRLRQICCNPQVGQLNINTRRYRTRHYLYNNQSSGSNKLVQTVKALKTLENVLEDMLESAIDQISKLERNLLQSCIETAQLFEFVLYPLDARRILSFASFCVQSIIARSKSHLIRAKKARNGLIKNESDVEDTDSTDEDELEDDAKLIDIQLTDSESREYDRLSEAIKLQGVRLRSWYLTLHKCYFLLASSYFQEYDEEYQQKIRDTRSSDWEDFAGSYTTNLSDSFDLDGITVLLNGSIPEATPVTEESVVSQYRETTTEGEPAEFTKLEFLEKSYYALAEEVRQKLLKSSMLNVSKAVESRITNREYFNNSSTEFTDDGTLFIPKSTKKFFKRLPITDISEFSDNVVGMKARLYMTKLDTFMDDLNEQARLINEWMGELINILCSPLLSHDQDPNGQEYEKTIEDQDKASCYLSLISKMLADRSNAIEGKEISTKIISNSKKKEQKDFENELERVNDKEFLQLLDSKRSEVSLPIKPSLNDLVRELKDLESKINDEHSIGSPDADIELELLDEAAKKIRQMFENQKLSSLLFQKELSTSCNFVFNSRIDYFKQLQQISDSVKMDATLSNAVANKEFLQSRFRSYTHDIGYIPRQISKVLTKFKYLQSLKRPGTDPESEDNMCVICRTSITLGSLTPCGHKYCKDCLEQWLIHHRNCPICKSNITASSIYNFTQYMPDLKANKISDRPDTSSNQNENLYSIYKHIEDEVVQDIQKIKLKHSYSSKVDMIVKQALYLKQQDPEVQIVVFSQWQDLLYILATAFKDAGISYLASYGTLTAEVGAGRPRSKFDSVEMFKDPANEITCFLLNAKAQASGLTLINATHIFLCEPLVNTSLELQAISRIHRIGQTKQTTVWMFAIENTVEESIVLLSTNKRLKYLHESEDSDNDKSILTTTTTSSFQSQENLSIAESITLTRSGGIDTLVNRGQGEGETVSNSDLWDAFFCAGASNDLSKTMNLDTMAKIQ